MTETTQEDIRNEYAYSPRVELEVEIAELRNRIAHIDRKILYRDESMPDDAFHWRKNEMGLCTFQCIDDSEGYVIDAAPDYRPDQDGPLTLAIIDPPEGE